MVNKKCLAGKTSVGNHLHRAKGGTCAKFQPNRMASLGDPGIQGAYLGVGKPKTQERARGPTHTRRIPYRMEIPAPSRYRTPECGKGSFGIRRRRACLGMPTDYGRRNVM